jgi:hypothetical protein
MARAAEKHSARVGVADHWGWAILVTVDRAGSLVDRRRVELVEEGLSKYPHHHDAQKLPVSEAIELIARVTRSVEACAEACLESLATSVAMPITAIALRVCPPLPETLPERLTNYTAQNVADSVMYREALAKAARARGWSVHWFEARDVAARAASALGRRNIEALLEETRTRLGRPWTKDHRLAMAGAIAAGAAKS